MEVTSLIDGLAKVWTRQCLVCSRRYACLVEILKVIDCVRIVQHASRPAERRRQAFGIRGKEGVGSNEKRWYHL